jgi:hemerythrin
MSESPAAQSIVDALRSDHRAIATQLADAIGEIDPIDAAAAREELVMMLVRHFVAEGQYLYPTVRDELEDGEALADGGLEADRACEHQLKRLEDDELGPDHVAETLSVVQAWLIDHVARQEAQFAALAGVCSAEQLAELGEGVRGAEQLAPTRPRSVAPTNVPANKVVSLVEGFIDQVRDHYSKRGVDADDAE